MSINAKTLLSALNETIVNLPVVITNCVVDEGNIILFFKEHNSKVNYAINIDIDYQLDESSKITNLLAYSLLATLASKRGDKFNALVIDYDNYTLDIWRNAKYTISADLLKVIMSLKTYLGIEQISLVYKLKSDANSVVVAFNLMDKGDLYEVVFHLRKSTAEVTSFVVKTIYNDENTLLELHSKAYFNLNNLTEISSNLVNYGMTMPGYLPTDSGKGRRKDSWTETNLAKARKAKGLKQADVAKELGLTASAYTKLEKRLSSALAYQRLRELSKLLDVSVDYLISDINVDYNSNID